MQEAAVAGFGLGIVEQKPEGDDPSKSEQEINNPVKEPAIERNDPDHAEQDRDSSNNLDVDEACRWPLSLWLESMDVRAHYCCNDLKMSAGVWTVDWCSY